MEFLHHLIVIDAYGAELLVQCGELGDVFERGTVGTDYPKFFGEDTGGNELRHRMQAGLLEKCEETGVFDGIEVDRVAVNGGVGLGTSATLAAAFFFFIIHTSEFFSGTITARRSIYALPLSPHNYRLRR